MASLTEEQVDATYRRYFPMIVRKCERMLRDGPAAEDVAQEVFIRLWNSRLDLRDLTATTSWLYKVATRLAIDRLRTPGARIQHSSELLEAIAHPEAGVEVRTHQRQVLGDVLALLPQPELEALVLSRVDRLSHPEIAEVMAVSERTVRRLLARADSRITEWRSIHEAAA